MWDRRRLRQSRDDRLLEEGLGDERRPPERRRKVARLRPRDERKRDAPLAQRSREIVAFAVAEIDVEERKIEPVGEASPGSGDRTADGRDVAFALDDGLQIESDEGMVFE